MPGCTGQSQGFKQGENQDKRMPPIGTGRPCGLGSSFQRGLPSRNDTRAAQTATQSRASYTSRGNCRGKNRAWGARSIDSVCTRESNRRHSSTATAHPRASGRPCPSRPRNPSAMFLAPRPRALLHPRTRARRASPRPRSRALRASPRPARPSRVPSSAPLLLRRRRLVRGHLNHEAGAAAGRGVDAHGAAQGLHRVLHDGQAQARAACGA